MPTLKQAKPSRFSMGLEKLGMCLFEGATTTVCPPVVNNKVLHGLSSPADIKIVEAHYGHPMTDYEFYGQLALTVPHTLHIIDPKNGEHLLTLGVLKVQGKLAPSVAEQADPNQNYQFVMEDLDAEAATGVSLYRKRTEAGAKLVNIDRDDPDYLIALCRFMAPHSAGVKTRDQAFAKLGEFIDGKLTRSSNEAVDYFNEHLDPAYGGQTPKEDIYIRVDVEEAIRLNIIRYDYQKTTYVNSAIPSDTNYGRSKEDVVNFLKSVSNLDHLGSGGAKDAPYSIRLQIAKQRNGTTGKG